MAAGGRWPLAVIPVGAASGGSLLWRLKGQLHGTVIVKARFWLRQGEFATPASPPAIAVKDRHRDRSPLKSLEEATDLAPYRRRCDVWLTGSCHGPPGEPRPTATVRLAIYRGIQTLIDKPLHVYGDRQSPTDEPTPFERMPLSYERAFGGAGVLNNPVGVGMADGDPQPNVVHPKYPSRPAGFGPIARYWRARAFELPDTIRQGLDKELIEVPDSFDWGYFQAAPRDQLIPPLAGDEWIVLDGMHPAGGRLQCRLPFVRAQARLWSHRATVADPGHEVGLVADTLAIDADEQICTVTWRGSFPLEDEQLVHTLRVGAGIAVRNKPIDWAPFWSADPAEYSTAAPSEQTDIDIDPTGTVVAVPRSEAEPPTQEARRDVPHGAGELPESQRDDDPLTRTAHMAPEDAPVPHGASPAAPFQLAPPTAHQAHGPLRPVSLPGAPWDRNEPTIGSTGAPADPLSVTQQSAVGPAPPSPLAPAPPPIVPAAPRAVPPPATTADHGGTLPSGARLPTLHSAAPAAAPPPSAQPAPAGGEALAAPQTPSAPRTPGAGESAEGPVTVELGSADEAATLPLGASRPEVGAGSGVPESPGRGKDSE